MNKKILNATLVAAIILVIILVIVKTNRFKDTIKYNGINYILLEYNFDIFTYNYNGNIYYEEDTIHPVFHKEYDVVYFNGDLFIKSNQIKKATKYYQQDKNYDWYIVFDNGEDEIKKSININDKELSSLYKIEEQEKKYTIVFNDIEMFADLLKVSKDGLVQGVTTLAKVKGNWYYKTEIMTDNDREYVLNIPKTLNEKIISIGADL